MSGGKFKRKVVGLLNSRYRLSCSLDSSNYDPTDLLLRSVKIVSFSVNFFIAFSHDFCTGSTCGLR